MGGDLRLIGRIILALVLATGALACDSEPLEPHRPPTLTLVEGDEQVGRAGAALEPFTVRAEEGDGTHIDSVDVVWMVTSGAGLFRVPVGTGWVLVESVAGQAGRPGPGMASVQFVPTELGTHTVTAYATRPNRHTVGSVDFTSQAEDVVIFVEENRDWEANWPAGPQNVAVDLGTTVEWQRKDRWGGNRVRSISVPAGGTAFDTALVRDSAFVFEPDAVGEWQWVWEREDADDWWPTILLDTATLVVR